MTTCELSASTHIEIGLQWMVDEYGRPVYGDHEPLVLGWSDDQLQPAVDLLQHRLPTGLTTRMGFAIASVALALVIEKTRSGNPLRYPRARDAYRIPKRYRRGGRYQTYQYVTTSMDVLLAAGLIDHDMGVWSPGRTGKQSVARATDELVKLLQPVIAPAVPQRVQTATETIVLRDRDDKKVIDFTDTDETEMMRAQVQIINQELAKLHLLHHGHQYDIPPGRRIFNGDFDRGGRFYCNGESFQNIPAEQRRDLQLVIDGVIHSMVEVDYSNLHAVMAYAAAGERMPKGDHYGIPGFHRGLVKLAFNIMLNAPTHNIGISAIVEELRTNHELRRAIHLGTSDRRVCRPRAKKVVAAIRSRHWRIRSYFGSDCGIRFQRQDSNMAIQVMLRMIQQTGRCPLPMHDSFLVADLDHKVLVQTMTEIATQNHLHLHLHLKDSQGRQWNPPPPQRAAASLFHKEVKNSDLGKQRKARARRNPGRDQVCGVIEGLHLHLPNIARRTDQRGPPGGWTQCCNRS